MLNQFVYVIFDYLNVSSINMDTHVIDIDVDIPKLRIQAQYNVEGKLLMVPVKGGGNIEANLSINNNYLTLVC